MPNRLQGGLLVAVAVLFAGCISSRPSYEPIPVLTRNDRIRVDYVYGGTAIGTLATIVSDTLYFAEGIFTPVDEIDRLSISGGVHRRQTEGALIGAVVGAALGVGVGLAFTDSDSEDRGSDVLTEALVFGLGGTMAGYWFGTISKKEKWIPIPESQWRSRPH